MPCGPGGGGRRAANQRWAIFVRNHAHAPVACDFCVVVTATFRILYVFVALEVGSRRLVHINVTSHPTAAWTLQQFREILTIPHPYRFVLHDRDSIYAPGLDAAITAMGVYASSGRRSTPQWRMRIASDYSEACAESVWIS